MKNNSEVFGVHEVPTKITSVHSVMGCPNARAGVKMVNSENNLEQPNHH